MRYAGGMQHHLALLGVVLALPMLLAGCPGDGLPPRGADRCADEATRCGPTGLPEACADRRWFASDPCVGGDACCLVAGIVGSAGPVHACAPAASCLPEGTAGGEGSAP